MTKHAAPNPDDPEARQTIDTTASPPLPAVPDAQPPALVEDWASIDFGDYAPPETRGRIPYYKLDRRLGEGFTDDETGEKGLQEISFVWLAKAATRAWFATEYGKGGDKFPTCRSTDALTPDANSPEVQSTSCAICPHNFFNRKADDEAKQCGESVEALVFIPSDNDVSIGRLAVIRFGGMSWKPALDYWGSFDRNLPVRPPLSVLTVATLEPKPTKYDSKVLVPHFERKDALSFEQAKVMMALRDDHKAEFLGRVAEEVATREAETENGSTTEASPAETVHVPGGEDF